MLFIIVCLVSNWVYAQSDLRDENPERLSVMAISNDLRTDMSLASTAVLGILILVILLEVPQGVKAAPSWGLDGIGSPLTTGHANDIIILVASCVGCYTGQISSVIDSSGLTFTQRANYTDVYFQIWEYYAVAKSRLSSDFVTVTWSHLNHGKWQVFAVHGYGGVHFDVSSPVTVSSGSCVGGFLGTCSATLETSGRDFVFAYLAEPDIGPCSLAPGWTYGYSNGYSELDYLVLKAPSPSVQFDCNNIETYSPILMDAILLRPG